MGVPAGYVYALPHEGTSYGPWSEEVRSESPSHMPSKRPRLRSEEYGYSMQQQEPEVIEYTEEVQYGYSHAEAWQDPNFNNAQRLQRSPEALGYAYGSSFKTLFSLGDSSTSTSVLPERKRKMQTGCIPCLIKGIPCDRNNPDCKQAMSDDWNLNYEDETEQDNGLLTPPNSMSLTIFRPDLKWRRSWRERHSLNFFVNFSAPQMAGFFDSSFWQRMVIQTSYHEPAILHAITAIGALHECIMQRAFADEKRKARATEFALNQCNKAIAYLMNTTTDDTDIDFTARSSKTPNSRIALTTCVLFTCFEAMQGRCDSAVSHALQGRHLLTATGRPNVTTMTPAEEDDLEQMRPIVERLEVQATALLDKGRRPGADGATRAPPLPPVDVIFSLDHAHNTLHTALNSIMRFMQGFNPSDKREQVAYTMAEKYMRYAPWFEVWEQAFSRFLAEARENMSNMDLKRAMVLKANHLVGTMLSSVDQSAGPAAYDAYENEFKAVVDLSREVLSSFSCPPLPTLSGGSSGTPYLSFSLWVTDPLWMAISRCRHPSIRQAAFTLLSQNPRQEGIWHAGPQIAPSKARRNEATPRGFIDTSDAASTPEGRATKRKYTSSSMSQRSTPSTNGTSSVNGSSYSSNSHLVTPLETELGEVPEVVENAAPCGSMRERANWIELRLAIDRARDGEYLRRDEERFQYWDETIHADETPAVEDSESPTSSQLPLEDVMKQHIPKKYTSYCKGNCSMPTRKQLDQLESEFGGWDGDG